MNICIYFYFIFIYDFFILKYEKIKKKNEYLINKKNK